MQNGSVKKGGTLRWRRTSKAVSHSLCKQQTRNSHVLAVRHKNVNKRAQRPASEWHTTLYFTTRKRFSFIRPPTPCDVTRCQLGTVFTTAGLCQLGEYLPRLLIRGNWSVRIILLVQTLTLLAIINYIYWIAAFSKGSPLIQTFLGHHPSRIFYVVPNYINFFSLTFYTSMISLLIITFLYAFPSWFSTTPSLIKDHFSAQ